MMQKYLVIFNDGTDLVIEAETSGVDSNNTNLLDFEVNHETVAVVSVMDLRSVRLVKP